MKVRITRDPTGVVDDVSLRHYHVGRAYDIPAVLAEYLVAEGFAAVEMRNQNRSTRPRKHDRRRLASSARP